MRVSRRGEANGGGNTMRRNEGGRGHSQARQAADWMRGRLVGALGSQGGSQTAFSILRQAAATYGPVATDEGLRLIHAESRSVGRLGQPD